MVLLINKIDKLEAQLPGGGGGGAALPLELGSIKSSALQSPQSLLCNHSDQLAALVGRGRG